MFWVKKLLSQFVMPLPFILILLLLAIVFKKKQMLSISLIAFALFLLILLTSSGGSHWLTEKLESKYAVNNIKAQAPCIVMVLGSGHDDNQDIPLAQQLSPTANMRLNEGLRQWKMNDNCLLVTSGWGGVYNHRSHAEVMADVAVERGIPRASIIILPLAKDTIEEAQYLRKQVGESPFKLVTSASHMPRAMTIFKQAGLKPQAAPADFRNRNGPWWELSPNNLVTSQRAIHEYVGLLWFYIKSHWL